LEPSGNDGKGERFQEIRMRVRNFNEFLNEVKKKIRK
jgi:hypothetical protein